LPRDADCASGVGLLERVDEKRLAQDPPEPGADIGDLYLTCGRLGRSENRDDAVSALSAGTDAGT
jgi:hypothetical protein